MKTSGKAAARKKLALVDVYERVPRLTDLKGMAQPIDWMIESVLPANSVVVLAGNYGSYKSTLARSMAIAVATGDRFAGHEVPQPRPVLYLDRENSINLIALRVDDLEFDEDDFARPFLYWSLELEAQGLTMPGIDSPLLIEWIEENHGLIVFDSMVRFHHSNENDNTEMARVMEKFIALARRGSTCLILHHKSKNKDSEFRGAGDIVAASDIGYSVRRNPDGSTLPDAIYTIELAPIRNRLDVETRRRYVLKNNRWERATTDRDFYTPGAKRSDPREPDDDDAFT